MNRIIIVLIAIALSVSCTQQNWIADQTGVTIYPEQSEENTAKAVRITPLSGGVFEVKSSASKVFSEEESLIILPFNSQPVFDVKEEGDELVITSQGYSIKVSKKTAKNAKEKEKQHDFTVFCYRPFYGD